MKIKAERISHTEVGSLVSTEEFEGTGKSTQMTRKIDLSINTKNEWFGFKNELQRIMKGMILDYGLKHDVQLSDCIVKAQSDPYYDWDKIVSGEWDPTFRPKF